MWTGGSKENSWNVKRKNTRNEKLHSGEMFEKGGRGNVGVPGNSCYFLIKKVPFKMSTTERWDYYFACVVFTFSFVLFWLELIGNLVQHNYYFFLFNLLHLTLICKVGSIYNGERVNFALLVVVSQKMEMFACNLHT